LQLILFQLVLISLVASEACISDRGSLVLLDLKLPTTQFLSIPVIRGVNKCSV